jgi:hypothetical protein
LIADDISLNDQAAILEAEKEINSEFLDSLTTESLESGNTGFEETALRAITASDGSRTELGVRVSISLLEDPAHLSV